MNPRILLIAVLALAGGGCNLIGALLPEHTMDSPDFSRVKGLTPHKLWEHLQEVVSEDFNIKVADDEAMELETEWNEHLGPMYKMGKRYQVAGRVVRDQGRLYVSISVRREVNTNLSRPLDRREAEWDSDGHDLSRERKLLWMIRMKLVKFAPSDRVLNPDKSKYLTDETAKEDDKLWSDGSGRPPGKSGGGGKPDIWKD